jgi:hypothetical protein
MMQNIVYFAGAGLTKALQIPDFPVPLMYDFVQVMAEYIEDPVIITTLAELEEMHLYEWSDPQAARLAKLLIGRDSDRSPANCAAFRVALKNRPAESIEDLLARIDEAQRNRSQREPRLPALRFVYGINRVFAVVDWNVNAGPLQRFVREQLTLHDSKHTFISFNYDLVLDRAVQSVSQGSWDVARDYGIHIGFCTNHLPDTKQRDSEYFEVLQLEPSGSSDGRTTILKPNGSLNWLVPLEHPYEQIHHGLAFEQRNPTIIVPLERGSQRLRYWSSVADFQRACFSRQRKDVLPCIVPPLSVKHTSIDFLRNIRQQESSVIKDADVIYILGWSMPKSDSDQIGLIEEAIAARTKSLDRVVVVNRSAGVEYFSRIQKTFAVPAERLEIWNSGFIEFAGMSMRNRACVGLT